MESNEPIVHKRRPAEGLYDPSYEHDACGIGLVANIKGKASHQIVRDGIAILLNLDHRGACGCEANTGDGAGILLQIPHAFMRKVFAERDVELPEPGEYGIGMVFLPVDHDERLRCEECIEEAVADAGQTVLGWRDVPCDNGTLGASAREREPMIRQLAIGRADPGGDIMNFERKLYVIRRTIENAIDRSDLKQKALFYFPSFSARTLVYKGMLRTEQLDAFFSDLSDPDMVSAMALVHSRFSTNTFPAWDLAHPYRYLIHNGEINTIRGNENWMHARQAVCESKLYGDDLAKLFPVVVPDGSDSGRFDNCLEFLMLSGWSPAHAVMMMIPEPWSKHKEMDPDRRAFYKYHSCLMEPWDGPASIAFCDGVQIGAVLDRNGLRPSRYYITSDDRVVMASEVGVLDVPPDQVVAKGRLEPGRMLLVDTVQGRIIDDDELKREIATSRPYREWVERNVVELTDLPASGKVVPESPETLLKRQRAFGYTFEELRMLLLPMAATGVEARGSMGNDAPLAVLSDQPQLLFSYFHQLFAEVTNPPLDAIREELVTSTEVMLGAEGNLLEPDETSCQRIRLRRPIITGAELAKLLEWDETGVRTTVLPMLFTVADGRAGLAPAMERLCQAADDAIASGAKIIVLSDRGMDAAQVPIPSALAVAGVHHHLIRRGTRTRVGLVVETGEARQIHHFAVLIGFGAGAICPYLAFESIRGMIDEELLTVVPYEEALKHYVKSATKGVVKVMSKMGISTVQSYCGAQIFEAVGLRSDLIDKYFTWTASRVGGIGVEDVATEALVRHERAFSERNGSPRTLDAGGSLQWRSDGERHLFNPKTIHALHRACTEGDYDLFREYSASVNDQQEELFTLRGMLKFKSVQDPVPLDEVESIESICSRFKTGAMSYGSISREAHEGLAIAMNRIGGRSNTGEGGEDPARFIADENGDRRRSAIKQVASGRFGVTSNYLVNADEIQIKMAQGAKPGEGGELPGRKVYPWIASVRGSTPGVGLISPPPHHDIYSIEDLAELIHDLKNANRAARISVKLVSEVGVGTIAAGVAKGHADVILISGADGGTGASPLTSIKHAGLPWELGLADTHQTLVLNDLRSRVALETDGQLKTGRDVIVACMLGAEEFGFSTAPLVAMGCIMMRVCHLDTCPVGVATQNPALRKKFRGDPDHVVNFMRFVAREMRELMAELGFRSIPEMVGRVDCLEVNEVVDHWKARGLDFSKILHQPNVPASVGRHWQIDQDHGLDSSLDVTKLLELCEPAIKRGEAVKASLPICNVNRVVGTIVGSEITKAHGAEGLPDDTISIDFDGSAGQSFAAFMPRGMTFRLEGDANDYFGKGLSGGRLVLVPPKASPFVPEENIIVGNVALYGATGGEAFIRGVAGERFCVRNSGAHAVVEGVGDHGCEYMTGGRVVVLGRTGRNFAAGMSGGIAYILDENETFPAHCNQELATIESMTEHDYEELEALVRRHAELTDSAVAWRLLGTWDDCRRRFVKVLPGDYHRAQKAIRQAESDGLDRDEALMQAFKINVLDPARASGN